MADMEHTAEETKGLLKRIMDALKNFLDKLMQSKSEKANNRLPYAELIKKTEEVLDALADIELNMSNKFDPQLHKTLTDFSSVVENLGDSEEDLSRKLTEIDKKMEDLKESMKGDTQNVKPIKERITGDSKLFVDNEQKNIYVFTKDEALRVWMILDEDGKPALRFESTDKQLSDMAGYRTLQIKSDEGLGTNLKEESTAMVKIIRELGFRYIDETKIERSELKKLFDKKKAYEEKAAPTEENGIKTLFDKKGGYVIYDSKNHRAMRLFKYKGQILMQGLNTTESFDINKCLGVKAEKLKADGCISSFKSLGKILTDEEGKLLQTTFNDTPKHIYGKYLHLPQTLEYLDYMGVNLYAIKNLRATPLVFIDEKSDAYKNVKCTAEALTRLYGQSRVTLVENKDNGTYVSVQAKFGDNIIVPFDGNGNTDKPFIIKDGGRSEIFDKDGNVSDCFKNRADIKEIAGCLYGDKTDKTKKDKEIEL